tara:strand:+ start:364 stop:984 length:621 start_codon:yes stop_codon:yes gene_type:complete
MIENNILGVILAGGKSKRMGKDKHLIKLGEKTLIEYTITKVQKLLKEVIIISNYKIDLAAQYNIEIVPDKLKEQQGPLVGIFTALDWIKKKNKKYNWIATFPCDTPFFPMSLIEKFIDLSINKKSELYFASSKGQRHNIFGLWSVNLYENLKKDILNTNIRKVQDWADRNNVEKIEFNFKDFDPFFNINTKEDLEKAIELKKNYND